jgi:anti-sigma regulatory factor (Ser/Thr protein kinase)
MTRVLEVPPVLDDAAFETLVAAAARDDEASGRTLVDARHVRFADPYGMIGLLALGEVLGRDGDPPILQLPISTEVMSYLQRMGFVQQSQQIFEVAATSRVREVRESTVLLQITPIRSHEDVHGVVEAINEGGVSALLSGQLNYSPMDAISFSTLLSEVSQNIIEHADAAGWVGIQTYNWQKRLGRKVAVISVMDLGIGFTGSLAREQAPRFGDRWSDATALEAAFIHGVTRFRDPGRGQGLKQIRKKVGVWGGKIAIRSGTARISDVPAWDDAHPMETELAYFPGTQILVVLPARDA